MALGYSAERYKDADGNYDFEGAVTKFCEGKSRLLQSATFLFFDSNAMKSTMKIFCLTPTKGIAQIVRTERRTEMMANHRNISCVVQQLCNLKVVR